MISDKITKKQSIAKSRAAKQRESVAKGRSAIDAAPYGGSLTEPAILLSHTAKKPESNMTALEKMQLARTGISKMDLEQLKHTTGLDYDCLAKGLAVTKATLFSKKGAEKFSTDLSEKIVSLADIYSYGYAVFEDVERFNAWMHRPNKALGGQTPYALVDNQFGREEVKDLIGRIEWGVYS